ncbi:unnamed protein product [Calypogeia fissa]
MTNAVDEGGGGLFTENGRGFLKSTGSSGSLKHNPHSGRGTSKAAAGCWGWGCVSTTLQRLWWFSIVGCTLSVLFLSFGLHVGRRGSCSPCAAIANTTGQGCDATFGSSSSSVSLEHHQIANNGHSKQEKEAMHMEGDLSYCENPSDLTMVHLFECAIHTGKENQLKTRALGEKALPRRVAFLFLARGELPLEPLWRRFFEGHEEFYSIYVHTHPRFSFKNNSFFYGHQVPSDSAQRFGITLLAAVRRLLAHAILDPIYGMTNTWFVLACEATIPLRSFEFTYNYLMESQHSFVDSFLPSDGNLQWFDGTNNTKNKTHRKTPFAREDTRKGEMWWAMQLHHALMVLEDWNVYYAYKSLCRYPCASDEQYIPTLLGMKDPQGIENRMVYFVYWPEGHHASPHTHQAQELTIDWFKDIKSRTIDQDGQYTDTSHDSQLTETHRISRSCYYNRVANSTCFLFARKVAANAREHLESLPASVLEY